MINFKLFKWVGGKKWLAPELNKLYLDNIKKDEYEYYIEPFAGGLGSFLFVLPTLKEKGIKTVVLNDINKTLITTYKAIKSKKNKVFKEYWELEEAYKSKIPKEAYKLHPQRDKEKLKDLLSEAQKYFYWAREQFNEYKNTNKVESVAFFLFLAQHSFNGLYRENSSGDYNAPYNWETGCPDKKKKRFMIDEYSKIFKEYNIIFENKDVFSFLRKYKKHSSNAIFYFDPPYLNIEIQETRYNKDHFDLKKQKKLLNLYTELDSVIFSNHYLEIFENFCEENNFDKLTAYRSSAMNSRGDRRSEKVAEILAFKFDK